MASLCPRKSQQLHKECGHVLNHRPAVVETKYVYLYTPNDISKIMILTPTILHEPTNESFLNTKSEIKAKSKWRSQKKLDLVDNLLDGEMREQEHEWSNYELEEYEAKTLISNTIFDIILMDTVECFQSIIIKKMKN